MSVRLLCIGCGRADDGTLVSVDKDYELGVVCDKCKKDMVKVTRCKDCVYSTRLGDNYICNEPSGSGKEWFFTEADSYCSKAVKPLRVEDIPQEVVKLCEVEEKHEQRTD